ncbi:MAG TPA: serine/threonine-protein kinase [Candidatus Polarisedimenticolaceae bacterium]|nr:serine/threonine-protein kinase [Candidatus Polarisedimenticolaceae bacterium]
MQVESLGRYRIDKELGRGAMGRVFLAYDPDIDRRIAIKTIQIFASLPPGERTLARERFLREARSAGKLLHPGIVTIFDVGEADGVPYLAMEFVEGATLDAFCREDTLLPVPTVVGLVAAAADALGFAHRQGIVHRDIKPANLMRVGETSVKIMDFGLAKNPTTSMTHDGALLGTPNYMAPEQVRGEALDGRADLFSLAVVLYEMLTGEKPFGGDSISSVLYRIVNEPPKEATLRLDRVPAPLAAFLTRALAKAPADRFPDAAAFAAALRRAGQGVGAAAAAARPAPVSRRGTPPSRSSPAVARRSIVPWIAAATAVALLLAGAAYRMRDRWMPPAVPMLEARVRTEPPGLPIRLDGAPLASGGVRFAAAGPYGRLTASQGCREASHRIDPGDAGGEIVLVLDPLRAEVGVDPGAAAAHVLVNGEATSSPSSVELDLCRENTIEARAEGFKPASVTIPAGATPLDARTLAGGIKLEPLPLGRLMLPPTRGGVAYFVDGKPVSRAGGTVTLTAGTHEVRAVDESRFIDIVSRVDVPAEGSASPSFEIPRMARLVVQTFPPDCTVALRRGAGPWRAIGETPLRHELAAGGYAMRIEAPSGETREASVELRPGLNPPVRVSFGRSQR